jgi:hypothetical protein
VRSRAAPHVRRDPTGGSCGRQSPQFRSVSPGLYLRLVGNDDGLTLKPVVFSVYVVDLEVENTARFAPEFRSWAKRSLSGSLFRTFGEQYDSSRDTRTDFIVCARIAFGTRSQPPGDLSITPSGVLCNPNRGYVPVVGGWRPNAKGGSPLIWLERGVSSVRGGSVTRDAESDQMEW